MKFFHPLDGPGFQTLDLQNKSLLPLPQDQASRQIKLKSLATLFLCYFRRNSKHRKFDRYELKI